MKHMAKKPVAVCDIDGTMLLNGKDGETKCVLHLRTLAEACQKSGISIVYITARPDSPDNRAHPERQLARCGIACHDKLYMMPPRADYGRYKWRARQQVLEDGYTILVSIGDQWADMTRKEPGLDDSKIYVGQIGDNGGFGIKLPSEFL
jgi:predicted secreted acid phosphatase